MGCNSPQRPIPACGSTASLDHVCRHHAQRPYTNMLSTFAGCNPQSRVHLHHRPLQYNSAARRELLSLLPAVAGLMAFTMELP